MSDQNTLPEHENVGLDQLENEFKPSKLSKMQSLLVDILKQNFNIDPTGTEFTVGIVTSLNKGQSWMIMGDSTDDQRFAIGGQELWAKSMIEKEFMDMQLNQNEIITMAKQKLKDEQEREKERLRKNS